MGDWFSQNAPAAKAAPTPAPAGGSGDWFDQNAPGSSAPAPTTPPPSGAGGSFDTDVAHQPASVSGVLKTLGSKEGLEAVADPITGFVKGIGDTVHGTGELIRKGLNKVSSNNLGDKVIPPVGQASLNEYSKSDNGAQWTGKALENVAEFMTGEGAVDEAGKAMNLSQKVQKLGSVAKFLEAHPFVAKMLARAGKDALTTGGQTTVKTGSPEEGAVGAGIGAVGGATSSAAGQGLQYVRDLYKPLTELGEGTIPESTGVIPEKSGVRDIKEVQPIFQKGIRDVAAQTATEAGVTAPTSSSIRDVFSDLGEQVKAKSQPVFQAVDDWSDKKFSDAQAAAKKYSGALDAAGKDKFEEALAKQDNLFQQYVKSEGAKFSPADLDKAKADWAQYKALQKVDDAVNGAVTGQRPELAAKSAVVQPAETANPKGAMLRLNRLYNDGTLETALGKDAAHNLLNHAGAAQQATDDILYNNRQTIAANRARNQAAIARNRQSNTLAIENNKAANERKLAGRRAVAITGATAATAGAAAAATGAGYKAIKSALGGGQ